MLKISEARLSDRHRDRSGGGTLASAHDRDRHPDTPKDLQSSPSHALVLASILFIGDKPTTMIGAYPMEVQRLLETVRLESRPVGERPAALRHQMMGRVLGRAIAHEIGHFLFGSADHAPAGLMRAKHRLDELTSPFPQAFRVMTTASALPQASHCR
jgi:hypothetical protein